MLITEASGASSKSDLIYTYTAELELSKNDINYVEPDYFSPHVMG